MSIEDQLPDNPFARFAEHCQMGLYHLTGNDSLPPRWGGVAYFGLLALNAAAWGRVALSYAGARYSTYRPAAAGELEPAIADPRFIPAAAGMPPWPAALELEEPAAEPAPVLEPAGPVRHLHALPTPATESEAA